MLDIGNLGLEARMNPARSRLAVSSRIRDEYALAIPNAFTHQ
jgi:hypothetical protein